MSESGFVSHTHPSRASTSALALAPPLFRLRLCLASLRRPAPVCMFVDIPLRLCYARIAPCIDYCPRLSPVIIPSSFVPCFSAPTRRRMHLSTSRRLRQNPSLLSHVCYPSRCASSTHASLRASTTAPGSRPSLFRLRLCLASLHRPAGVCMFDDIASSSAESFPALACLLPVAFRRQLLPSVPSLLLCVCVVLRHTRARPSSHMLSQHRLCIPGCQKEAATLVLVWVGWGSSVSFDLAHTCERRRNTDERSEESKTTDHIIFIKESVTEHGPQHVLPKWKTRTVTRRGMHNPSDKQYRRPVRLLCYRYTMDGARLWAAR